MFHAGSMGTPFAELTLNVIKGATRWICVRNRLAGETRDSVAQRTRMEAVKAMFYAFRDRVESLGSDSHARALATEALRHSSRCAFKIIEVFLSAPRLDSGGQTHLGLLQFDDKAQGPTEPSHLAGGAHVRHHALPGPLRITRGRHEEAGADGDLLFHRRGA